MSSAAAASFSFPSELRNEFGQCISVLMLLLCQKRMGLSIELEQRRRWHELIGNLVRVTVPGTPPVLGTLGAEKPLRWPQFLEEYLRGLVSLRVVARGGVGYELPLGTAKLWALQFDALSAEERQFFTGIALPFARLAGFR